MPIIGLGNDLLRIERIRRMGARNGQMLLQRALHPAERAETDAADWRRVAGILASKEAFFKALGTGLVQPLRWVDVIVSGLKRAPKLVLTGETATAFATRGGISSVLTLCGDEVFMLATVILFGCEKAGPEGGFPAGLPPGSKDSRSHKPELLPQQPIPGALAFGAARSQTLDIQTLTMQTWAIHVER
jgi:holo-[acyl-carrier protein] synthase